VGDAIACSPLVKTAIHGNDPTGGDLAAAVYSGEPVEPERIRLCFGDDDRVQLLDRGLPVPFDAGQARTSSARILRDPPGSRARPGLGDRLDLRSVGRVRRVNADYTT